MNHLFMKKKMKEYAIEYHTNEILLIYLSLVFFDNHV